MSRYKILLGEVLKPSKKINIGSGVVLTQNIPSDKNLGIDLIEEFYGHPISQKTCIEIKEYTKKILELTSTPKNLKDFFYERFKVL